MSSFQSASGGLVHSLVTNLTLKSVAPHGLPRNPKTLLWKSGQLNSKLEVGLKARLSPSFHESQSSYKRFSAYDPKVNRMNPFKDLGYFKNKTVLLSTTALTGESIKNGRGFSTATAENLSLSKRNKNHQITLPLSNNQKVLFTIIDESEIGKFSQNVQREDPSIKSVTIQTKDGVRFAGDTTWSEVLSGPFQIVFNNKTYNVNPTSRILTSAEPVSPYGQVQNVAEYQRLKQELIPIYAKKVELDRKSERQANAIIYAGLGYLVAQGAFLARLTWWDFNWDIMEPVTYFVTFGAVLIGYIYFTITRREYTFSDIRQSALNSRMFKNYLKYDFPIEKFYSIAHKLKQSDPEAMEKIDYEISRGLHNDLLKPKQEVIEKAAAI